MSAQKSMNRKINVLKQTKTVTFGFNENNWKSTKDCNI